MYIWLISVKTESKSNSLFDTRVFVVFFFLPEAGWLLIVDVEKILNAQSQIGLKFLSVPQLIIYDATKGLS